MIVHFNIKHVQYSDRECILLQLPSFNYLRKDLIKKLLKQHVLLTDGIHEILSTFLADYFIFADLTFFSSFLLTKI